MRILPIEIYACRCGEAFFAARRVCERCGGTLARVRVPPVGTLLSHTIVRVNPTGEPLSLGLVRLVSGASTLCEIRGRVRGNGHDRVVLIPEDGRFVALGAGWRQDERRG